MAKKSAILRHLNMRALKAAVYSTLCRLPGVRGYLNYYQQSVGFEDAALPGSVRTLKISPWRDYGLTYTQRERSDLLAQGLAPDSVKVTFKMARMEDVTILGSSGVTLDNKSGKVLAMGPSGGPVPRNWVIARPLRQVSSDETAIYINLLGVRNGHRHFAHFFSDTLIPLFVFLKRWSDPSERLVCLVREDLSQMQRDVFGFVADEYPFLAFQELANDAKVRCGNSIFIAYQNPHSGKDNMLVRDCLVEIRDFLMRHYRIDTLPASRRLYISRGDARLRRVANEAELAGVLADYGFEAYEMGELPFARQIELFASAEAIVAPHGAGLMNLMFCQPGARVLEVFPENFVTDWFTGFAKVLGLDYDYLLAGRGKPVSMAYDIAPAALREKLEAMALEVGKG